MKKKGSNNHVKRKSTAELGVLAMPAVIM